MDTQAIEIIGRNRLVNELLQAGLEVALPLRDHGIDLIAYADSGEGVTAFVACPIQMKAASGKAFSIDRKYEKFPNLIHAFVWNVTSPDGAETYALTHGEAIAIGDKMGWTRTPSWGRGSYVTSSPSRKLLELLVPYRMTPEAWRQKVMRLQAIS
jgi:hypothetical protein